jgi:hypothetical protein
MNTYNYDLKWNIIIEDEETMIGERRKENILKCTYESNIGFMTTKTCSRTYA